MIFVLNRLFFNKCKDFLIKHLRPPEHKTAESPAAILRISNGCVQRCAYCVIWRAVGKLRSKSVEQICKEYKSLLDAGYRKFTFTADNLGAYGTDIDSSFDKLLGSLSEIDKGLDVRWALIELHPYWIIKYKDAFLELVKNKKISLILCAIQSGADRILKLMNRRHRIDEITNILIAFKKANPDIKIFTQIIIGFPSETETEFLHTLDAVKKAGFEGASVYPYYDGLDSLSSKMPGKISQDIINERVKTAIKFLNRYLIWH